MGVCSAGGGDSLNNLFLDFSKGTAFPPGSQAADLPTPLQKCMAQPDPFSQECSPGKSQAPSRRHSICPDSLLPPSLTGLSLIPDPGARQCHCCWPEHPFLVLGAVTALGSGWESASRCWEPASHCWEPASRCWRTLRCFSVPPAFPSLLHDQAQHGLPCPCWRNLRAHWL